MIDLKKVWKNIISGSKMEKSTKILLLLDIIFGVFLIPFLNIDLKTSLIVIIASLVLSPISLFLMQLQIKFWTYINKSEMIKINPVKLIFGSSILILILFLVNYILQDEGLALQSLFFISFSLFLLFRFTIRTSDDSE